MMNGIILVLASSLSVFHFHGPAKEKPPTVYSLPLPPKPDYSMVDWLVGEWDGKSAVPSPPGDAHLSVTYDLDKRIVVLKETIHFAGTGDVPASDEQWMGILTEDSGGRGYSLSVYSSTGFITRYRAAAEKAVIHFHPAGGELPPSGWLFRRTLTRASETAFTEVVQAAPPDKPFFDYYTIQFTRVTPVPKGAPAATPPPAAPPKP